MRTGHKKGPQQMSSTVPQQNGRFIGGSVGNQQLPNEYPYGRNRYDDDYDTLAGNAYPRRRPYGGKIPYGAPHSAYPNPENYGRRKGTHRIPHNIQKRDDTKNILLRKTKKRGKRDAKDNSYLGTLGNVVTGFRSLYKRIRRYLLPQLQTSGKNVHSGIPKRVVTHRKRRHVGPHDEDGLQRLLSTGTLAPTTLSPQHAQYNHSIDYIFASYWFFPDDSTQTVLPEDKECVTERLRHEDGRFDPDSKFCFIVLVLCV
jgi:hypothetical protein